MKTAPLILFGLMLIFHVIPTGYAATYRIGSTDCSQGVTYQPEETVDYQEGVDAKGWAVVPADMNPPVLTAKDFESVDVELDIPVSDYLERNVYNYDDSRSDIRLGTVNIHKDGETRLNDKLLSNDTIINPECEE